MNLDKIFKKLQWFLGASGVINNFPDALVFINNDGYVTQINRRAGEVFVLSDRDGLLMLNDFIPEGMQSVRTSIKHKKPVLTKANVGGHMFYVELMAAKRADGFCISLRDQTNLAKEHDKELKIEKFSNDKNAMLMKIKPDVTSHIEAIEGFSKGLLDGIGGELTEKQDKYVNIIHNNAKELKTLVKKLLDFTCVESLMYEEDDKKFDIVATIKEISKDISKKYPSKKIEFLFDYESLIQRFIYTDEKAFRNIIENILEVSYEMTENGTLSITLQPVDEEFFMTFALREERTYFQIVIKDTGVGVEPDEVKTLCNPYYYADKGKKDFLRSLRLGIASILIKRIDGFFDITSELMSGTTYNIVLPTEKEENE